MYQAIFFDLDGTLLPMDNDEFTKGYFHMLSKVLEPYGYTEKILVPAMWKGVGSMVKNDGSRVNFDAFWETFSGIIGQGICKHIPVFDEFYKKGFNDAIVFTKPTPLAKKAISIARTKAQKVVLATNPFFPPVAVEARLNWAGLSWDDFDHITHYSNSCFCKPNPAYYLEISDTIGVDPTKCLMVGNNTKEDVEASVAVGFDSYLITDCLISEGDMPNTKKGSFEDFISFLESIN